jgi:hypothetical protein
MLSALARSAAFITRIAVPGAVLLYSAASFAARLYISGVAKTLRESPDADPLSSLLLPPLRELQARSRLMIIKWDAFFMTVGIYRFYSVLFVKILY